IHLTERPGLETWLLDYKEVKPGCWFPMTQVHADFRGWSREKGWRGTYSRPFEERSELRAVSLTVDQPLPEATFLAPALREAASATDRTSDPPRNYTYRTADSEKKRQKQREEALEQGEKQAKELREKPTGRAAGVDLTTIDRTITREPKYSSRPYYALLVIGP